MRNYKNAVAVAFVFVGVVLVLLTELNLWPRLNTITYSTLFSYLIMAAEILALGKCVQLYRRYGNPFFKIQYIVLFVTIAYAIVKKIRLTLLTPATPGVFGNFSDIHGLGFVVSLATSLLTVFALLVYLEGSGQPGEGPGARMYELVPAAANNKMFWPAIIGGPLLIYAVQLAGVTGISREFIFSSLQVLIQSTVSLASTLLGLLLALSLHSIYRNKLFKWLATAYVIEIVLMGLTFVNSALFMVMAVGNPSPSIIIIDKLFLFVVVASKLAVALINMYAFFTYKESMG